MMSTHTRFQCLSIALVELNLFWRAVLPFKTTCTWASNVDMYACVITSGPFVCEPKVKVLSMVKVVLLAKVKRIE